LESYISVLIVSMVCGVVWLVGVYYFKHSIRNEWNAYIKI